MISWSHVLAHSAYDFLKPCAVNDKVLVLLQPSRTSSSRSALLPRPIRQGLCLQRNEKFLWGLKFAPIPLPYWGKWRFGNPPHQGKWRFGCFRRFKKKIPLQLSEPPLPWGKWRFGCFWRFRKLYTIANIRSPPSGKAKIWLFLEIWKINHWKYQNPSPPPISESEALDVLVRRFRKFYHCKHQNPFPSPH